MNKDFFSEFQHKAKKIEETPTQEAWLRLQSKLDSHLLVKKNRRRDLFNMNIYWIAASVIGILCISTLAITFIGKNNTQPLANLIKETPQDTKLTESNEVNIPQIQSSPVEKSNLKQKIDIKHKTNNIITKNNENPIPKIEPKEEIAEVDLTQKNDNQLLDEVAKPKPIQNNDQKIKEYADYVQSSPKKSDQIRSDAKVSRMVVQKSNQSTKGFTGDWVDQNGNLYQIINNSGSYSLQINEKILYNTPDCSEGILLFRDQLKSYQFKLIDKNQMELKIFDTTANNFVKIILRKN